LRSWLRPVREGRLDKHFCHEAECVCLNGGLAMN
jgi:hypothetical protein